MTKNSPYPLISICIPTYNGERYLEQCLNSAIAQTYKQVEIIICDDSSTDNTWNMVSAYAAKDARIKVFRNDKNLGLVGNWNRCMELAGGEWIKFLFQDDYLSLDCIETMVKAIEPNDKIVCSRRNMVFESDVDKESKEYAIRETITFEKLGYRAEQSAHIPAKKISHFAASNIRMNFVGEPTVVMFKKDVTSELGVFNPDLIQICDLEYFLRIGTRYGVKYVPKSVTYFRAGGHAGSTTGFNKKNKYYSMRYIDPLIMVHLMLYDKFFAHFRSLINVKEKIKLILFFRLNATEAWKSSKESDEWNDLFIHAAAKYPNIEKFKRGSIITFLLGKILKR